MNKILILHGWGYSTERWTPFLKLMIDEGLKPQLLEIPGLTAPIDSAWILDDYVEWLKSKIGKDKVILVGHSNGGRISIAFALKYPEKLERLILVDSAGVYHNELPIRLKRFVFKNLARMGRKMGLQESSRRFLYKLAGTADYKDATSQMRQTMVNLISADLTPELNKITAPTLIIWGEQDKTTPLRDGELMHKLIPHSKLYVIKGAYHSPQFTHPKEVWDKISKEINASF